MQWLIGSLNFIKNSKYNVNFKQQQQGENTTGGKKQLYQNRCNKHNALFKAQDSTNMQNKQLILEVKTFMEFTQ